MWKMAKSNHGEEREEGGERARGAAQGKGRPNVTYVHALHHVQVNGLPWTTNSQHGIRDDLGQLVRQLEGG
jgi:hypothetical protein